MVIYVFRLILPLYYICFAAPLMSVLPQKLATGTKLTSLKLAEVSFWYSVLPACHIHVNCNV